MWGIRGRILPLSNQPDLVEDEDDVFTGRVWIEDGRILAITRGTRKGPPGYRDAPVIDVRPNLIVPGLIDLHNHLAYNTLPLWTEPTQQTPFEHHNSWPRAKSYPTDTTWPAYALITACPEELLAYVETKALVGGTTSIQGSPPMNRPRDGWLVRNIDDETFGTGRSDLIYVSVLTASSATLAKRANSMRDGSGFIYHCSEGQRGSIVAREFTDAAAAGCLQPTFVAVHANAVDPSVYADWTNSGAIAWSPFSNLWLYGETTDVPAALAAGLTVCLGSDWAPSGTKNVLGELKSARITADALGWELSNAEIVKMATCRPGDVLDRAWGRQTGRLQPGALADLVVFTASSRADPFRTVLRATEDTVRLVIVDGIPCYGEPELMDQAQATHAGPGPTTLRVGGRTMALSLTRQKEPTQTWEFSEVIARLEQVRADPKANIEQAQARMALFSGNLDDQEAPLRIALDMPTGEGPIGGLPKDLDKIVVPPLETLTHDDQWLASVRDRGFHRGVLDELASFYG